MPALEEFATREITLRRGQAQPFQGLLEQLQKLDYDSEAVCEAPGHYAINPSRFDPLKIQFPISRHRDTELKTYD